MKRLLSNRPSPALVISMIALFVALGGTVYAAHKINGKAVRKGSLPGNRIKKHTVTGNRLKKKTLTSAQINLGKLGSVPNAEHANNADSASSANSANSANVANALSDLSVFPMKRVLATDGANEAAARSAAPENVFYTKGPFTVYAKCFRDTSTNDVYGEVYIRTSQNGSIFYSDDDSLYGSGGEFLDTATPETDRWLSDGDSPASLNDASAEDADYTPFWAMAPDGTTLQGANWVAEKSGTLPGGSQGVYGSGNVCLFTGRIFNS